MENAEVLISTSYLPSIYYFNKIISASAITVEAMENYPKQTLRNRCFIYAANGPLCLTIPIQKKERQFQVVKDIMIDYTYPWQKIHWRSIVSAYNSSPFFMYYDYLLEPFYNKKIKFMLDFNNELLDKVLNDILKFKAGINVTKDYTIKAENSNDLRYLCNSKSYKNQYSSISFKEYYQVFAAKHGFIPNLSIVDLLFNEGKSAGEYLKCKWY